MIPEDSGSPSKRVKCLKTEALSQCRRYRDFTNFLDLQHKHHNRFLGKLRSFSELYSWNDLQLSETKRGHCIDHFLETHAMEYWGTEENRSQHLMSDSIERGDVVSYPEHRDEIRKTLVLLLKRQADSKVKGEHKEEQSQVTLPIIGKRKATEDHKYVPEEEDKEEGGLGLKMANDDRAPVGENATKEEKNAEAYEFIDSDGRADPSVASDKNKNKADHTSDAVEATEHKTEQADAGPEAGLAYMTPKNAPELAHSAKRRIFADASIRMRYPESESDSDSISSTRTTLHSPITVAPESSSAGSTSLVNEHFAAALRTKYRRDTYFQVTTDADPIAPEHPIAPTWVKMMNVTSASAFLLRMGRERGLEERWWNPNTQMEVEGAAQPDYVNAARGIIAMASVRLEWSGEEVLVRWGNDVDFQIVLKLIQKAWMGHEFGFQNIDVFNVRVVLHLN
ncbi:hypothetical protein BJX61DRAFT_422443 [Aspergillus egyptiacus]|nr:hypothetical protein BJX61DRAFT_422443 [Aspergillus egyptiacus]